MVCLFSLPFVALAVLVASGPGSGLPAKVASFLRADATRFGWFAPAAVVGILGGNRWLGSPERRRLLPLGLAGFAMSHIGDMYGALIALAVVCVAATDGVEWIASRVPRHGTRVSTVALALTLTGALLIVGIRSVQATPRRIYAAAAFLEKHDPEGPFVIYAPGMARSQIQGYVSGCPRFDLVTQGPAEVRFLRPPALRGDPVHVVQRLISWLRHLIVVTGVHTRWYGETPRIYSVRVDEQGGRPSSREPLFSDNGIEVFGPAAR